MFSKPPPYKWRRPIPQPKMQRVIQPQRQAINHPQPTYEEPNEAIAERVLNHYAPDVVILFCDIVTPDTEGLSGEDELHLRLQAVHIDRAPALTPTVLHILRTTTVADATECILRWVRENPEAHALKLFDIYDNLYCIMRTGVNNRALPQSLRLSIGEGASLKEPQTQSFVERYLSFLDTFWLPLVATDDATRQPIMKLLETKRNVAYDSTTSTAVFCMMHGLASFETPEAAQPFMSD